MRRAQAYETMEKLVIACVYIEIIVFFLVFLYLAPTLSPSLFLPLSPYLLPLSPYISLPLSSFLFLLTSLPSLSLSLPPSSLFLLTSLPSPPLLRYKQAYCDYQVALRIDSRVDKARESSSRYAFSEDTRHNRHSSSIRQEYTTRSISLHWITLYICHSYMYVHVLHG